jgi:uncharacterized cupredoxin-like copper-binding protein
MKPVFLARALTAATFTAATLLIALPTLAGPGASGHGDDSGASIGKPANASAANRTVTVEMHDNYYTPEKISVKAGETVRFVVKNKGQLVHEFNIGTHKMHVAHRPEMMMMVEHGVLEADRINMKAAKQMQATMGHGMHDEPNSVLLEPGKTGEVVWTFPKRADIEFACNVPGHYEAGMQGKFELTR